MLLAHLPPEEQETGDEKKSDRAMEKERWKRKRWAEAEPPLKGGAGL